MHKLYYQPAGFWFGDCMPFGKGDEFYLFHQRDTRKPGPFGEPFGWDLATTKDFVHYEDKGVAIPRGGDDEQGGLLSRKIDEVDGLLMGLGHQRDLPDLLEEVMGRGDAIPKGSCWRLGGCGAVLSCGAFLSAVCDVRHDDPEGWGLVHRLTGSCFSAIGGIGGPRCCDRSANVSMRMTVDAVRERLGVDMQWSDPVCTHHQGNNLCLGSACPFNPGRE